MICTMDEVERAADAARHGVPDAGAARALELARAEDEAIWTREWVCVGLSSEIPEAGDLLPCTVGDHAIHIQRSPDGGLVGRFNKAQHGGCRVVPLQCRQGAKTPCSFTSCGHSLDRPAIRAGELGEGTPQMFQYLGLRPERLLPVRIAAFGPLLFAHLDPHGPGFADSAAALRRSAPGFGETGHPANGCAMEWMDCDANWKHVAAHLLAAGAMAGPADGPVYAVDRPDGSSAVLHFPNLVLLQAAGSLCVVVLQPVALARTRCRFAVLGAAHGVAWRDRLMACLAAARRAQERSGRTDPFVLDEPSDARGHWLWTVVLGRVNARMAGEEGVIHG